MTKLDSKPGKRPALLQSPQKNPDNRDLCRGINGTNGPGLEKGVISDCLYRLLGNDTDSEGSLA